MAKYVANAGYDWISVGKHGWSLPTSGLSGMSFVAGESSSTTLVFTDDDGTITRIAGTGLAATVGGISWTKLTVIEHLDEAEMLLESITSLQGFQTAGNAALSGIGSLVLNGADTATGSAGKDNISTGNGNDTIDGGDDNDSLSGGAGVDVISGGAGNDTIHGGAGPDQLQGGDGDDVLSLTSPLEYTPAGGKNEGLIGGGGNDTITLDGPGSYDLRQTYFESIEVLRFGVGGATATVDRDGNFEATATIDGSEGADKLVITNVGFSGDFSALKFVDWTAGEDTIEIWNAISSIGTTKNDTFIAPQAPPFTGIAYDGREGDDIFVFNAPDTGGEVAGGLGYDEIRVGGGIVFPLYLAGVEELRFTGSGSLVDFIGVPNANYKLLHIAEPPGANSLRFSGLAVNDLSGLVFDDWIDGKDTIVMLGLHGNDKLTGSSKDDTIYGDIGNDSLYGGNGIDTAVFEGSRSQYSVTTLNDGSTLVKLLDGSQADRLFNIELLRFGGINGNTSPYIEGGDSVTAFVCENSGTGEGSILITGRDLGDTIKLEIVGGADAALFKLRSYDENGFDALLEFGSAPDFEAPGDFDKNNSYVVKVRATDSQGEFDEQTITINVLNENEPPVITSNGGGDTAAIMLAENTNDVTKVVATDPEGVPICYEIVGGADRTVFVIDHTTGALSFDPAHLPNFELPSDVGKNRTYQVEVAAIEGGNALTSMGSFGSSYSDTQLITVSITNKNDAPTDILLTPTPNAAKFEVDEGAAAGTVVGNMLKVIDEDKSDKWTFSVDNAAFQIVGTELRVKNGSLISYEDTVTEILNVTAKDSGGLTTVKQFTVEVRDVPEPPTLTLDSSLYTYEWTNFNRAYYSDGAPGAILNESDSDAIGYLTVINPEGPTPDASELVISTSPPGLAITASELSDGQYVFYAKVDYEKTPSFDFTVSWHGVEKTAHVNITDLDDLVFGLLPSELISTGQQNDMAYAQGGNDTVNGQNGDDTLFGQGDKDILNGGAGADTLDGGFDNDVLNGGADDDLLKGSSGLDTLNGGTGDDALDGGADNDTLNGNEHDDALKGAAGADSLNGGAGDDTIVGGADNDTIDGGIGLDWMRGGAGDDRYLIDDANDEAFEKVGEGTSDRAVTKVSYALTRGQQIEVLETSNAAGTGTMSLTGNNLANTVIGNAGTNTIDGGLGQDTLHGGNGVDRFSFSTSLGASNVDVIADFNVAADTILLENGIFDQLATKAGATLTAGAFVLGAAAKDADDRILFDSATGALRYDSDGTGAAAAVTFATLQSPIGTISAADFFVV